MKTRSADARYLPQLLFYVAALALGIAFTVLRFRHPELTETQLFLYSPALTYGGSAVLLALCLWAAWASRR